MSLRMKWLGSSALAALAIVGMAAPPAAGQRTPLFVPSVAQQAINPNFRIAPDLSIGQAAFNTAVLGQAIRNVPPYALGYNPYPQVANFGPSYPLAASGFPYSGATLATNPYLGGSTTATLATNPYGSGYNDPSQANPYYGGYNYYESPYAGYLRGVADVTNANGRYLSQVQQARLLQSQADVSKLDLRRRIIDEAAIDRKNWLNPEAERLKDMEAAYSRATREPPFTEVLSGQALNALYDHVYPLQLKGVKGPNVPLDEDMLKQINLAGAGSRGSIGVLKDRGKLNWPFALQAPEYESARKRMTTLAADAVDQVRLNNPVGVASIRDMMGDVKSMNETLMKNIGEISPDDYVDAKRFLNRLDGAVKALQDPNVANQLNQKWAAKARNVAELVDLMSKEGLRFAGATPGDEQAYRYLYQRMVAYDSGTSQLAAVPK